MEAEAILGVLAQCVSGKIELISSEMLEYEAERNPLLVRQTHTRTVLSTARYFVEVTEHVEWRAENLMKHGIKLVDALHTALAESASADYFCTCDDRFLNKLRRVSDLNVKPKSPLELIQELGI